MLRNDIYDRNTMVKRLTLFDMVFFIFSLGGGHDGPHRNFLVYAPISMKIGTGVEHDVFYTMAANNFLTSLLLRNYDVIALFMQNTFA